MQEVDHITRLLRACARVELGDDDRARVADAVSAVNDWTALDFWGRHHGLTPLLRRHLASYSAALPEHTWRQLTAGALRDRVAGRVQREVLGETVRQLTRAGIDHIVLKGAALAHALYPEPDLRPMRDLDILVGRREAEGARRALAGIGFDVAAGNTGGTSRFHHHLPAITCARRGVQAALEIHVSALSGDRAESLRIDDARERRQIVTADGVRLTIFSHAHMLRHLAAHALEPAEHTRLLSVTDLVGYASRYRDEINWNDLGCRDPGTLNALSLMHFITPLPDGLAWLRPPTEAEPAGAGRGFTPLATLARRPRRLARDLADLLSPSEWWLRAYYGVPPHAGLTGVRWVRHPGRLARWGFRRFVEASWRTAGGRAW